MGINRWSDIEQRKRNETDAKAGDEVPKAKKGDASSRLQASEGPKENEKNARSSRSSRSASRSPSLSKKVETQEKNHIWTKATTPRAPSSGI